VSGRPIVAYVSGHGLGHSVREVEILRHLPTGIPLIVKSTAPEWFWRAELDRAFLFVRDSFDVGCIQRSGMEIDIEGTLTAWQEMRERNRTRYEAEADFLRAENARLVVSDVPSLPLVAAARAGVPSACIVNFTWADIYRRFETDGYPAFGPIADELEAEYAQATLAIEAGFAVPMPYFPRKESVGVVARQGSARREALLSVLPESTRDKRLALVYVGGWGLPIPYERVTAFKDWHFLSLDAPPAVPENWTVLSRDLMPHPNLVASVDLVISKPGYGIAGECTVAGTPLLYPPRPEFAEYPALDAALADWPGAFRLPAEEFLTVEWGATLACIPARGKTPRRAARGGPKAAELLLRLFA
jgi:hypothetical protein